MWNDSTSLALGGMIEEWDALFYETLKCPMPGRDFPYVKSGWPEMVRLKFQQAIPEYPLLGRVWDYYLDIWYKPEEMADLRSECLMAKSRTTGNALAEKAIEQFLYACDEALERGFGLEIRGP